VLAAAERLGRRAEIHESGIWVLGSGKADS
jgi:hypothetical protein